MKEIPLTQGYTAQVSDEDYERVSQFGWYAGAMGPRKFYGMRHSATVEGRRKTILLHRFVLDAPAGLLVDHIDNNGLNCQRSNLRLCTVAENMWNRRMDLRNTSGYKGVNWSKPNHFWVAAIRFRTRLIHIGCFATAEDAARAYDAKAIELFGEFAHLNFPPIL